MHGVAVLQVVDELDATLLDPVLNARLLVSNTLEFIDESPLGGGEGLERDEHLLVQFDSVSVLRGASEASWFELHGGVDGHGGVGGLCEQALGGGVGSAKGVVKAVCDIGSLVERVLCDLFEERIRERAGDRRGLRHRRHD